MKLDLHCHTEEGSLDGKFPIEEYMKKLISLGYDGMLVTDHDSYNGYRYYRDCLKEKYPAFKVFKGIEYDTIDAGHIIVIMPEIVKLRILECRGLPVRVLQEIVHHHGGVLGPAHPCGERHLAFCRSRCYKKHPEIMESFDFVEAFNSCESEESNAKAKELSLKYNLPTFAGSDAHWEACVGTAYTETEEMFTKESDFINYIKEKKPFSYGGTYFKGTVKNRIGFLNHFLVEGFWFYNHFAALYRSRKRRIQMKLLKLNGALKI